MIPSRARSVVRHYLLVSAGLVLIAYGETLAARAGRMSHGLDETRFARTAAIVSADENSEHNDALKARARGEIRSLEEILQSLKISKTDRLVDVDLRRIDGRWIYEVTWLTKSGRYRVFTIDATNAFILKDEIK